MTACARVRKCAARGGFTFSTGTGQHGEVHFEHPDAICRTAAIAKAMSVLLAEEHVTVEIMGVNHEIVFCGQMLSAAEIIKKRKGDARAMRRKWGDNV